MNRVYLDWNATAPLCPEARAAMLAAMDAVGNPSSVHAEGRTAKAIVEKARGQVAALVGCEPSEVVFTSGATEAANTVLRRWDFPEPSRCVIWISGAEHECMLGYQSEYTMHLNLDRHGGFWIKDLSKTIDWDATFDERPKVFVVGIANGETGIVAAREILAAVAAIEVAEFIIDATQALGKMRFSFAETKSDFAVLSAHKFGGPKGIGAAIQRDAFDLNTRIESGPLLIGGGQEQGRRAGTENVLGIAGFGAAAEAAQRDLEDGAWDRVAQLRDSLEERLEAAAPDLHVFGKDVLRLPNTSCFAIPGWKGETQVMQMDLAGYAVSAGSACSSGKVNKASRVLLAMGYDEETASSAIRVSMGPTTTEAEVMGFADTWIEHYRRRKQRAA